MKERRSNTNGHHKNGKFSDYYKVSIQMEADTEANQSSNVAYVFPGQGAQFVGMGRELYQSSKAAKELYDEVDDILSFPLTRLLMEGPEEELQKTVNSQPAIMATSLACLAALNEVPEHGYDRPRSPCRAQPGRVHVPWWCPGATSLEDGMRLVQERGRLMQESLGGVPWKHGGDYRPGRGHPGRDLPGKRAPRWRTLTGPSRSCSAATGYALPGQSTWLPCGEPNGLSRWQLEGAFHSSLMSPAAEGLKTAMESVELRDPGGAPS